jgi:hypothetical protein
VRAADSPLSLRSGRSLRSLGSPLNARPLGGRRQDYGDVLRDHEDFNT